MNPQSERKCLGDAAVTGTGTVHVWLVCVLSKLTPFHSNLENKSFFVSCSLLITKQSQWKSLAWNHPASGWRETLPSHRSNFLSLDAKAVLGLSTAPHPCPHIPSLLRHLPHSDIWRKVLWMALQANVSCSFTQILSLLQEEVYEPLWRTWTIGWGQLLLSTAELQIFQQGWNAQKGRWKLKKRDNPLNTSFALFIDLFQSY